ncbi:phospholipase/carboxylesterase [Planococcus antarcticus DSM 14505]|uniref:Phospholipase/carboxylesterase n=1 Tax=Planococcus antarcticus DSM 14505 TaxID=1185653 RepID=A0AA87IPC2_9BACL|nr:alpha/beta fold hydrolase [Planococcus antarcticus]EIM08431.1 phospholipase/carboxylesterase [Planococcus antarcticus DSM 14505]
MSEIKGFPFENHIYAPTKTNIGKTIIIFHGWGASTKNYNEFANYLSSQGFQVVVPEIVFHDSRNKLENHFRKEITQKYFWQVIFSSIDEATCLFRELKISEKDVILLGISMGGFIANGIYANAQEIAGLININGSGSFLLSEKIFRESDNRPQLSFEEIRTLTSYDPICKNKGVSPILLMHGEQDAVVSIKGQEDYYAYLTKESPTSDIAFLKYKDINHTISEEMTKDLIRWLEEHF